MSILDAIGNTSLVPLRKIAANISVKLEWENPTGSMKDRMAVAPRNSIKCARSARSSRSCRAKAD